MKNLLRRIAKKGGRRLLRRSLTDAQIVASLNQAAAIAFFIGGGIGDAIMAWPALAFCARCRPHARLDVFAPAAQGRLLQSLFAPLGIKSLTATTIAGFLAHRKNPPYDISFTNTIAAFSVRIELAARTSCSAAYGFCYPDESVAERSYDRCRAQHATDHDIVQNIALVSGAFAMPFTEQDQCYPPSLWNPAIAETPFVLIHPGVRQGYAYKMWPEDNYRAIIEKLREKKYKIKILIGPADRDSGVAFSNIKGVEFLVEPEASVLLNEFKQATLFLGNDSGPAHIAAFLGVPGITLIGPVDPRRSEPRGPNSLTIYNRQSCSPCHFGRRSCRDSICMRNITVEQVWAAVERCFCCGNI
ncbi:MAG: glycosyltransferase family 9 protein [Chitinivibrionales bacterium]|nr:glycosyltransferase family 9 protein [Chitinivibrionales bacterium]